VAKIDSSAFELPEDSASLQAMVQQLQVELLRVKLELERYKKWYYGPRADRLQSHQDVAQLLLNFAEELDQKPINTDDLPKAAEPAEELRRVKRRRGRRNLANFENLPVTTHVYELSEAERACPCCGLTRKEIGADESWQVEYYPGHFERIHHVCKKYACTRCETNGENPSIQAAKKPEMAIDKGLAGPGLLSYIVTSKFSDYLPLYRLEDIFSRQGFEISRATQSVWCGDVADFVEPLYQLMADRVRASHVVATDDTIMPMQSKDKTANARMWVYVGDGAQPYNVFDFTMDRGRESSRTPPTNAMVDGFGVCEGRLLCHLGGVGDRCEVCQILDGAVGQTRQHGGQVLADGHAQLAAAFHDGENSRYLGTSFLAADLQPVAPSDCYGPH
jgi:transposase